MGRTEVIENATKEFVDFMGGEENAKPYQSDFQSGLEMALLRSKLTHSPYLVEYVKATANLPLPTNKQISNFADHITKQDSWYKFSGTMEFLVFMEAFPRYQIDGSRLVEITQENARQCRDGRTTKAFVEAFGYLGSIPILVGYDTDYGGVGPMGMHIGSQYIGGEPNTSLKMITDQNDASKTVPIPPEFFALNRKMKCKYVYSIPVAMQLVSMREIVKETRNLLAKNTQ